MPLFNIALPPELGIFFGYIMKIASFDLVPVDTWVQDYGDLTPRDPINSNFEAVGFESMYTLSNLGTILILILLFPILAVIIKLLKCVGGARAHRLSKKIEAKLYWNATIQVIKESYAIALMCCFINLTAFYWVTIGECISSLLTILILVVGGFFPLILAWLILVNYDLLEHPNVKNIIGVAYSGMRMHNENDPLKPAVMKKISEKKSKKRKSQFIFFSIFFYLRRIILALTVIYLKSNLIW